MSRAGKVVTPTMNAVYAHSRYMAGRTAGRHLSHVQFVPSISAAALLSPIVETSPSALRRRALLALRFFRTDSDWAACFRAAVGVIAVTSAR